jgi:hypothetical protein
MEVSGHRPEKEKTQIYRKNLSIECVLQKQNNYKQIAVIPEELIDKPEIIEILKIVEETNKKLVN